MKFFKDPEPVDKFLFWSYLSLGLLITVCGFYFRFSPPEIGPCGELQGDRGQSVVCWAAAALCLALAENRRSGWFFWT